MNRIIVQTILLINFVNCNSQKGKNISNFEKLNVIQFQIDNNTTNEKSYISLDSLRKVVDGADAELYVETYKNAIIYDTHKLLKYLEKKHEKVDENVLAFFEQDEKTFKLINEKLKSNNRNDTKGYINNSYAYKNKHVITRKDISHKIPNPNGYWKINCSNGNASMTINNKTAFLEVMFNQIYVELVELKRYNSEKGIAYKLKEIPEDKGTFGVKLNWKEYVNDKSIAYIKVIDKNTLYFYWYGFYNSRTKKREFTECQFQQEINQKNESNIVLVNCKSNE